jgi:hypothetical protein
MDKDISGIIDGWDHEPAQIIVRKITGRDGMPKLQLRIDLGLLQMELDGRPDGRRPYGQESLLEHYEAEIKRQEAESSGAAEFLLESDDCHDLQEEALQYYHRYLSLLALGDYERAERDTARNLRVFDLVWNYALRESDKWALERHRPYVILMNTRARVAASLEQGERDGAIRQITEGMQRIRQSITERDHEKLRDPRAELAFLEAWLEDIRESCPPGRVDKLREELAGAVDIEDSDRADRLRDEINRLEMSED